MEQMQYCLRTRGEHGRADTAFLSREQIKKAASFHATLPGYAPTPLVKLDGLAKEIGVGAVYLKDESKRFGLNAFKALGGSWAIADYLKDTLGLEGEVTFDTLRTALAGREPITFITATDGNHGRGVAWTARVLGQKAVVYMPKGSAAERLENIRAQGAQAKITEYNYDDTVRLAARDGEENGWVLVQDTAWPGYETIPTRIVQGYGTLALEIVEQLRDRGEDVPTHLFLQGGVGSFAGAVLGCMVEAYGKDYPITTIMEPNKADCIYRSAAADDGKLHFVTGDMDTIMAGLACGEPCTVVWPVLNSYADAFVSCDDETAAEGMRLLGKSAGDDPVVISGESGAVGAGLLERIMSGRHEELRRALKLNETSRVLLVSTEGDTDRENYRKIVFG
ncbi:MAG: diaminopropionate ammonia-lyase [Ruminococcaceae bacterium]|nr:diaminopropionate ammonia-lyase [Oscillospiraceae bacterium]